MKVSIDYALHEDTENLANDEISQLINEGILSHALKFTDADSIKIKVENFIGPAGGNPNVSIEMDNDENLLSILNSMGYEEGEYLIV